VGPACRLGGHGGRPGFCSDELALRPAESEQWFAVPLLLKVKTVPAFLARAFSSFDRRRGEASTGFKLSRCGASERGGLESLPVLEPVRRLDRRRLWRSGYRLADDSGPQIGSSSLVNSADESPSTDTMCA
jgi:hypothetical protein